MTNRKYDSEITQGPNIRLEVVTVLVDSLWRHVIRRPHQRLGCRRLGTEESPEAKIAEFDDTLARDEHIRGLDVYKNDKSKIVVPIFLSRILVVTIVFCES